MTMLRISLAVLIAGSLAACGDDPTSPEVERRTGPVADSPVIPLPAAPGADVPPVSEVMTVISATPITRFAPRVLDVDMAQAAIQARTSPQCAWTVIDAPGAGRMADWTGTLSANFFGCDSDPGAVFVISSERTALHPTANQLLFDGNDWNLTLRRDLRAGEVIRPLGNGGPGYVRTTIQATAAPGELPYLRRDRFWRLRPIDGGVGNYLLLSGPTTASITTSFTQGVSTTETETFGRTITGGAGLDLGALRVSTSQTLSTSFSSSVEITEQTTVSVTQTARGEEGKKVQFSLWELVEVYSLTDANGDPFTVDGWTFAQDELERGGVSTWMEATVFPND